MNGAVDDESDPQKEQSNGPGPRLKAAREAAGLDLARVASQLHISTDQVEALEADRFDQFPARVFVRGYLRNYARLVGLSADGVLARFEDVWPEGQGSAPLRRVGSQRPQVSSGHGIVRAVSWALLLGLGVLFFVWWAGYLQDHDGSPDAVAPSTDDASEPAGLEMPPIALTEDGSLPLPPPPTASLDPTSVPDEPSDTQSTATTVEPSDEISAVAETDTGAADAQPAEPEPAAPVLAPQVVLSLTGPCWVSIRDSSGDYRLVGQYNAGFREVLGGTPPYRIRLGNAPVATLTVDGQPVDLAAHQRGQVARLTLNPGAQ